MSVVRICSSCTARQQEMERLRRRVRQLEKELAVFLPDLKLSANQINCAACGHRHPQVMTRHHRVPRRIAWKIPHAARTEVLGDQPEIINLCQKCHRFIEQASSTSNSNAQLTPCSEAIDVSATVTWAQLMDEIRMFERIAEKYTEDVQAVMRSGDGSDDPSPFAEALKTAVASQ